MIKCVIVKEQEAKELLSPLGKVPVLGDILFQIDKMNKKLNKPSLAGDKYIPEIYLKQSWFMDKALWTIH